MRMFASKHMVFTIVILAATGVVFAIAQARVQGTVTDSQGNPIPDAVITITGDPAQDFINFNKVVTASNRHAQMNAIRIDQIGLGRQAYQRCIVSSQDQLGCKQRAI